MNVHTWGTYMYVFPTILIPLIFLALIDIDKRLGDFQKPLETPLPTPLLTIFVQS